MNAYGSQSELGLTSSGSTKGRFRSPSKQISKDWSKEGGGGKERRGAKDPSQNIYLIPIAVGETFVLCGLIAMNYCFRFDPTARDASSLADYTNVDLQPSDLLPYRPYYNYSVDHEDNQNSTPSLASFGITFGMPEYAFFVTAFVFPFLVILSVELGKSFLCAGKPRKSVDSLGIMFPSSARRILRFLFVYLLFGSMAGMLTSFLKLLLPLPRPHFLAVCLDDDSEVLPLDRAVSLTDCTNTNSDEVWEALRSFPSYHATIAVYGGAFVCLYIYYTLKFRGNYTVTIMLSLPVFVMAAIGAFHRWVTFHASFRDIIWGGLIGLLLALHAVYGLLNKFKERPSLTLPITAPPAPAPAPAPFTPLPLPPPPPPAPLQHVVRHNPAFVEDEHVGSNHYGRRPMTKAPGGRPAQAFNSTFGMENDYRQPPEAPSRRANYNQPRQRFSAAPPPEPDHVHPRPASAYPAPRAHHPAPPRARSRYEGASYF